MTILVIGPSHAAGFKDMLQNNERALAESVHVAAIHGAAFGSGQLFKEVAKGIISLQQGVDRAGRTFRWRTSKEIDINHVNLNDYSKILLLSPLFIVSGIFGKVLFGGKSGGFAGCEEGSPNYFSIKQKTLCLDFLKSDKRLLALLSQDIHLISKSVYYEIYKNDKSQDIKLFEIMSRGCNTNKVSILPPVVPPLRNRKSNGLLGIYHLQEQDYLLKTLYAKYGINGFPQPSTTYFENQSGIFTKDEFHMPPPDPHHPSKKYWYLLAESLGLFNKS